MPDEPALGQNHQNVLPDAPGLARNVVATIGLVTFTARIQCQSCGHAQSLSYMMQLSLPIDRDQRAFARQRFLYALHMDFDPARLRGFTIFPSRHSCGGSATISINYGEEHPQDRDRNIWHTEWER